MFQHEAEIIADNIVSDRTLRTDHLLCNMYSYLKRHDPDKAASFYTLWHDALDDAADTSSDIVGDDDYDLEASNCLDSLENILENMTPDGYRFGAHDGDGACFGYWKDDE